jgi:membrane protease YdiL (CAAX protease family)
MEKSRYDKHKIVFWIVLSALLFVRFPLESWAIYLFPSTSLWIDPIYQICTYSLVVFLIWWERERLALYHMDSLAIIFIIFFKPISIVLLPLLGGAKNPIAFPKPLSFVFFVIALILLALIIRKKISLTRLSRNTLIWLILGGVFGISLSAIFTIIMIGWLNYPVPSYPGLMALIAPIYQMGFAAVAEEPVFRGFLWGGLRNLGLKDIWILLIQATLFASGHIHLLASPQPILLLSLTFITAVCFGLLVWRSRSLSSSMAMHAFYNGSPMVLYWISSLLFR